MARRSGNRVSPNCVERAPERRSPTGIDRRRRSKPRTAGSHGTQARGRPPVGTAGRRPAAAWTLTVGMAPFSARTPDDRVARRPGTAYPRTAWSARRSAVSDRHRPRGGRKRTAVCSRDAGKGSPTSGSGTQTRGGVDADRRDGSFLGACPRQGGAQAREPRTPEPRGASAGAPVSDRHRPPEAVETTYRQSRRIAGTAWIADLRPVLPVGVGTARRRRAELRRTVCLDGAVRKSLSERHDRTTIHRPFTLHLSTPP